MSLSPRSFALHLALTKGIGGRTVSRILARNELLSRSPEEFLAYDPSVWREEYGLSKRASDNLTAISTDELQALERRLDALGVTIITTADAHYPAQLEAFDSDPPGVLFLYGNHKLLDANTFCVLASRNSKPVELDAIERWTEEGVLNGEILVTGHDRKEYQRSAIVPLRWGSPRILCLDRGLFSVLGPDLKDEAFRAARLWRYEFDPQTDLVISPFRPESGFFGVNNQVRDRLIGGLSKRLRFSAISEGGNMEKIARMALKCGRNVEVSDTCLSYRELRALGATVI